MRLVSLLQRWFIERTEPDVHLLRCRIDNIKLIEQSFALNMIVESLYARLAQARVHNADLNQKIQQRDAVIDELRASLIEADRIHSELFKSSQP